MNPFSHKPMHSYQLLINTLSSNLHITLYEDKELCETFIYEQKTSDILTEALEQLLKSYPIDTLIYTNGPGSHMATKLTYIALKTLSIAKGLELKAVSGFLLSNNKPIKAIGNRYFIKEKETIILKKIEATQATSFHMPKSLNDMVFEQNNEPLYMLPAV